MIMTPAFLLLLAISIEEPAKKPAADLSALKVFAPLVGKWKGTATPKDQSAKDRSFWREQVDWQWVITKERTGVSWRADTSKRFREGFISFDSKQDEYTLEIKTLEGETVTLVGKRTENVVEFEGEGRDGERWKFTLRLVGPDRYTVMLSTKAKGKSTYKRTLEIGYTREGSAFFKGTGQPECIVTGGAGTIRVQHEGKTYYVCCEGCKEAFYADPKQYVDAKRKK